MLRTRGDVRSFSRDLRFTVALYGAAYHYPPFESGSELYEPNRPAARKLR